MPNSSSSLRFDHREIAVIFLLFIFVSLLMFTVGILVGKGLTQAKYEGGGYSVERNLSSAPSAHPAETAGSVGAGSSVTTPTEEMTSGTSENIVEKSAIGSPSSQTASVEAPPLKLVPQKAKDPNAPGSLLEPRVSPEAESILKNPRLQALMEQDPKTARKLNSQGFPESYASGKYTVQIVAYPNQKEAAERVETLKKLGFPHAHFSAKELLDSKETWYRVWLGYFPDQDSANEAGKALTARGEVKKYIVKKVDSSGRAD